MANIRSIGGNPIVLGMDGLDDDVIEEFDLKADIDGYYAQLTAGAADNLTARGDGVTASFLYRTTAGSASVPDKGEATVRSIKGRTLVWNQLCNGVNTTVQVAGVTKTVTSSGGLSAHGTVTTTPDYGLLYIGANTVLRRDGRKYLFMLSKEVDFPIGVSGYDSRAANYRRAFIWSNNGGGIWNGSPVAYVSEGDTVDFDDVHASVFDLTAMFGAGSEPATVEEFEALYPAPYYAYESGDLLPVRMTGVETTGFNQWDEQWESGQFNTTTGAKVAASDRIRSKNYIPVFPSTAYYFECSTTSNAFTVCYYDADKGFIGAAYPSMNSVVTTPANARYLMFTPPVAYGTTYNHDICINFHWSGYMDGTYETYWSEQRVIAAIAENFPDGMRGVGDNCDELTEHEAIHRVGSVDLGALTWTTQAIPDTDKLRFMAVGIKNDVAKPSANNVAADVRCAKYNTVTANQTYTAVTGISIQTDGTIYVYDPAYTDPAAFKAALSGVTLHYALATLTTTTFDQPINMDYRFADFGTERILVPTGQMSAPPTMDVAYGLNATDTLRTLPTEYISKASDASFTAALAAALNLTITRTWDETVGRYDYTITQNGE